MGKSQEDLILFLPLLTLRTEGESYQSCSLAELLQDLEPKAMSHFYKALMLCW